MAGREVRLPRLRPRRTGDGPHAGVLGQLPGILSWGGGGRDPSTGIAPTHDQAEGRSQYGHRNERPGKRKEVRTGKGL